MSVDHAAAVASHSAAASVMRCMLSSPVCPQTVRFVCGLSSIFSASAAYESRSLRLRGVRRPP